jgi:hypothetical protein
MEKDRAQADPAAKITDLLRKQIVVQLALAGVGQAQIRKVVGGSMAEINGIAKLIRPIKRGKSGDAGLV